MMGVILKINKGDSKEEIEKKKKAFEKVTSGFPAHKFTGKIKFDEEALTYQRKIRDEWE